MAAASEAPADRLRLAFELIDLAERMLRQRLHRDHPDLTDAQLDARIDAWYLHRPGARDGDADGTPGPWPRR
ncbi:MAG: hypothetical protein IPL61_37085 [Myxococcales bacterium]|nr:hypothetical protein [Myxococcales bacterium]